MITKHQLKISYENKAPNLLTFSKKYVSFVSSYDLAWWVKVCLHVTFFSPCSLLPLLLNAFSLLGSVQRIENGLISYSACYSLIRTVYIGTILNFKGDNNGHGLKNVTVQTVLKVYRLWAHVHQSLPKFNTLSTELHRLGSEPILSVKVNLMVTLTETGTETVHLNGPFKITKGLCKVYRSYSFLSFRFNVGTGTLLTTAFVVPTTALPAS